MFVADDFSVMLSDGSVGPGGGGGEDGHREEGAQRLLPGPHHQQDHQVARLLSSKAGLQIRNLSPDTGSESGSRSISE